MYVRMCVYIYIYICVCVYTCMYINVDGWLVIPVDNEDNPYTCLNMGNMN